MAVIRPSVKPGAPGCTLRFRVPHVPEAVEAARRRVEAELRLWGMADRQELSYDIRLVLSELLTNAMVHGRGPLTVAVQHDVDLVIVEVIDAHSDLPVVRTPAAGEESGRGLSVVNAVAYTHGCEPLPRGKRCWAVFRIP
jgi:anti-sigma regulatory factor (Ser/Thr protein kinase)